MKNENHIQNLKIQNFKSIKEMDLDCGRINLFIGKPNVGKSNILEAMSLLGGHYSTNESKVFSEFIRYEKFRNLFFQQDKQYGIYIHSNRYFLKVKFVENKYIAELRYGEYSKNGTSDNFFWNKEISINGELLNRSERDLSEVYKKPSYDIRRDFSNVDKSPSKVHRYTFANEVFNQLSLISSDEWFLLPPYGLNLLEILKQNQKIADEIGGFFEPYGYELLLDLEDEKLAIQRRVGRVVQKVPFSLIADTLQRIIFYLTAVESNNNSVILLEEPEVHAYPPYVRMLAHRIVDSESNQFFITTHSPYLFTTIIENTKAEDLRVFLVDFEDYQTTVQQMATEDIEEIKMNGMDIFLNLSFFKDAARV